MGKIDELIKQFCPDGVQKVPLGDVLDYEQPSKYIVKSTEYDNSYNIPVLTAGKGFLLGYTNEQAGVYAASEENPTIIFDDFVTSFHWVDFPFKVKSSAMKMLTCKNKGNSFRFIYYAMCEIGFVAKEHSRHWISVYSKIEIPLPPLAVQKKIVEILDTFTGMIDNLQKELEQRQKQFEYYQEKILKFEDGIETFSFGESFHLKARIGWQGLTKKEYRTEGAYKLVTGTDFTNNHRIDFEKCVYIDKDRYDQDENIQLKEDDVLITKDGTLGKIAYIDKLKYPATLNGGVFVVRDKTGRIKQKFTQHYLSSSIFKKWIESNHTSGSIQHLTQKLLVKFRIPVPPLDKQQEIVDKLDTFEALISNIKQEIELRQKQYEYYREKLLTFE